jgi:CheY-like chemotaxis protein
MATVSAFSWRCFLYPSTLLCNNTSVPALDPCAKGATAKEERMSESILNEKRILAVDDEPDVLALLKEEILSAAPECLIDTATTYREAADLLVSWTYDLVILDVMGVRGFDLLKSTSTRVNPVPTVILTAQAFSPEALKRSIQLGARAYLPKEFLGNLVPFLEDVLTYEYGPAWKRLMKEVEGVFVKGWGPYWRKPDSAFWAEFEKKISEAK